MKSSYYHGKSALITGGSSGIGLAFAKHLASLGAHVWILARRMEVLATAKQEIESVRLDATQTVGTLCADICDRELVTAVLKEHLALHGAPDILFNGAGITHPALFVDTPIEIFDDIIGTNYLGTINVIRVFLPAMLARGSGHVAIVGSGAGFLGIIGYSAYCSSKFALRGLADVLRVECKPSGVKVHYIAPADTQTPQLDYENQFKPAITREFVGSGSVVHSPEEVAVTVAREMARGRYMIVPAAEARLYYNITNSFGVFYPIVDLVLNRAWKKVNRSKGNGSRQD
jgi:3-dehydrosphinganine reductase